MKAQLFVIDDDEKIAKLVSRLLRREGYDVVTIYSAEEAMMIAKYIQSDLIITDVMMPHITGRELVNKIREGATLYPKDLPVIIISALYELSDKVGGIQDGADDYLVKPFEADELLVRVLSLLRRNPPKYVEHIELKREEYFLEKIAVQVELNDNEKRFLYRIMSREGVPISKHDLLRLIYPNAIGNPDGRGLQMMVGRLKKKLEQYGYDGIKIKRGEGYYWDF